MSSNGDEQIDLGHIVQGLVNMKTELDDLKNTVKIELGENVKMREEMRQELNESIQKQTEIIEELLQSIESITKASIPAPDVPVESTDLTLEQQHFISTLNTLTTRIFEGVGDLKARLELLEGNIREIENRIITLNERVANMDGTISRAVNEFEQGAARWFELSKYQIKVVLVAVGVVGAAVGVKEIFDFLPKIFGW